MHFPSSRLQLVISALFLGCSLTAHATAQVGDVFVIAMENQNWTQPDNQFTGGQQQVYNNPAAPYISGLVNGTNAISNQVAYASNYHNVLSTPSGNNASIHPSEPNYFWAEGGTNYGVLNDNDPYGNGGTSQNTSAHLSTLLTNAGKTWKSYQEDTDLATVNGKLTSTPLPSSQYTVPLSSFSGTSSSYVNPYNGSNQYNYAAKHDPQVLFNDTNGGNNPTSSNPLAQNYAPLQQLQTDLNNNTVANYNWITPDQYNDMHTALSAGYKGLTGDAARIAQGDNFLSIIVPEIMASQAYQNNGAIVLWWDETEGTATGSTNDYSHTIGEIVISKLAHPNVNGLPFDSTVDLTHSDDLHTWQNLYGVNQTYLGDAANAQGIDSLFAPGAVSGVPEPESYALMVIGMGMLGLFARRRLRQ